MTSNDKNNRSNRFGRNNRDNDRFDHSKGFGVDRNWINNDQRNKLKVEEQLAPIEKRKDDINNDKYKDLGMYRFLILMTNGNEMKRKIPIYRTGSRDLS